MRASLLVLANTFSVALATPVGGAVGAKLAQLTQNFGLASWDIEGYAKNNPVATTTGGKGGRTVYVSTADELIAAGQSSETLTIYVNGEIELPRRLNLTSNKSLLGVGNKAHIRQHGITVRHHNNVIIRNLKISHIYDDDCITLVNSTRLWIDHNEFYSDIELGPDFYVSSTLLPSFTQTLTSQSGRSSRHQPSFRLDHCELELLPRSLEVLAGG